MITHRPQRAITLVEVTIVLAIMGLIIGGIWMLTAGAMNARKKQHLAEQVITTASKLRNYYSRQDAGAFAAITDAAATTPAARQLLPADMIKGTNLRHVYGGAVRINAVSAAAQTPSRFFFVGLVDLPADACVDLLYARLGSNAELARTLGFIGYATGAANASPTAYTALPATFNLDTATTACNGVSGTSPGLYLAFSL